MEWIAATNNAHKLEEMRRILGRMGHIVLSQKEAGIALEPEETGTTFAENAAIKARAIANASGKAAIADDSGLCVNALNGAPGVYSARFCGHHGDDDANNDKLLQEMQSVPKAQRGARFVSAICVVFPDGTEAVWEGECPGSIAFEPQGINGFGYDPLFIPVFVGKDLENKEQFTYAQLTAQQKDAISHRGAALMKMEQELPNLLNQKTNQKEQTNVNE